MNNLLRILNTLLLAGVFATLVLILLKIRQPLEIHEPISIHGGVSVQGVDPTTVLEARPVLVEISQ
jgi:hypothetical protein